MKKIRINIVVTIVIGTLILSSANLIAGVNSSDGSGISKGVEDVEMVQVEKQVWNGTDWSETTTVNLGDTVHFKVTVYNPNSDYEVEFSGRIYDQFPCNLRYINGSSDIFRDYPPGVQERLEVVDWINNTVYWLRPPSIPPLGNLTFTFNATAVSCGIGVNNVTVSPDALVPIDDGDPIPNENGILDVSDTATVEVSCLDINVEKYVKLDCSSDFKKEINAEIDDLIVFKIFLNNTGEVALDVKIIDELPIALQYNNNATPWEPNYTLYPLNGKIIYIWEYTNLLPGESFIVTFEAIVKECGEHVNNVKAVGTYNCETIEEDDKAVVNVECPPTPCLQYNPTQHDFGYMDECEHASTTFEIWNNCSGTLEYTLSWDCGWITSVTPNHGTSTGEHDTITVEIYTAGLYWGHTYTCQINITSNGGNATFTITVTIGNPPPTPYLQYNPTQHDFGTMQPGETANTTFEIWNNGSGVLNYSLLIESEYWVTVTPNHGNSTGEHDLITVEINTTGLSEGTHTCPIQITSNGGTGTFIVTVEISSEMYPPTVNITKPMEKTLYIRDKETIKLPINLIIGPITIEAEATDTDGNITQVEFYINDELKNTTNQEPYQYYWNEKTFGLKTIKVKAYDNQGLTNEDTIKIFILNFGLMN